MTTTTTATNAEPVTSAKARPPGPLVRALTGTMWRFWCFLLVVSLAAAAVIYYVWLRGNL